MRAVQLYGIDNDGALAPPEREAVLADGEEGDQRSAPEFAPIPCSSLAAYGFWLSIASWKLKT